jgi:hypothetical protein
MSPSRLLREAPQRFAEKPASSSLLLRTPAKWTGHGRYVGKTVS